MNRQAGKEALQTVLKVQKNIDTLEKYIYDLTKPYEHKYFDSIYQIVGRVINGEKLNTILQSLKEGNIGWESPEFQEYQIKLEEEDDFLTKPFEVEEGVLECNRCGSKRTFSYSKQTRRADEGTSVFVKCAQCNNSWVISG